MKVWVNSYVSKGLYVENDIFYSLEDALKEKDRVVNFRKKEYKEDTKTVNDFLKTEGWASYKIGNDWYYIKKIKIK